LPRDTVCLRNISVNTLYKGDDDDRNNSNDNNNKAEKCQADIDLVHVTALYLPPDKDYIKMTQENGMKQKDTVRATLNFTG